MRRSVLSSIFLVLAAVFAQAQQAASPADSVFLWLAGGLSGARIQRLMQTPGAPAALSCRTQACVQQCSRALQRSGAEPTVAQKLVPAASPVASDEGSRACSGLASRIAMLVHERHYSDADDQLRTLSQSGADNDRYRALVHLVLGTVLAREERLDDAMDELTAAAHLAPGSPEIHNQLSYLFYRTDDSDDALAEARTALSIDPANAEAYRFLGLSLYAEGHYDAALHAIEEALKREPAGSVASADTYFDMGITYRDQGDPRRAAMAYRHAINLRPDFWQAHSNLGVALHDMNKLDEAIAEYRTAKRLNPEEASVRSNLGNTLCDKQDFDSAIAEFKDLYKQSPEWEGGHNCLARAYMSRKDYASAVIELKAAIAVNPAGAAEHRVLGQALLLEGKDQEAVDALRQAVLLNPESGLSHHYLGTALVNTQKLGEAEKEFREALRLEPSAQNHYSLAACLMAMNHYEEALGELEIASRMDPGEDLYRARMQEVVRLITASK